MHRVIWDNSIAIRKAKMEEEQRIKENLQTHKNYGKVPKYIDKYNQQREDAEIRQMIEEEKAKIPPGTRLMPEEERQDTLNDLISSKKEINTALEKLPIKSKTLAMEKHKKELESKLARVERAIETFSKKIVYVAY